jgi:hypothetical protein
MQFKRQTEDKRHCNSMETNGAVSLSLSLSLSLCRTRLFDGMIGLAKRFSFKSKDPSFLLFCLTSEEESLLLEQLQFILLFPPVSRTISPS